jgi:hypothetical protein
MGRLSSINIVTAYGLGLRAPFPTRVRQYAEGQPTSWPANAGRFHPGSKAAGPGREADRSPPCMVLGVGLRVHALIHGVVLSWLGTETAVSYIQYFININNFYLKPFLHNACWTKCV